MNWHDIWTLYRTELRAAMRERTIVVNSVLIPILLYPALIFLMISGFSFIGMRSEALQTRIEVAGEDRVPAATDFVARLEENESVELIRTENGENATARIEAGDVDARIELLPADDGVPGNFQVRLLADSADDRSSNAAERVRRALSDDRGRLLDDLARSADIADAEWRPFEIVEENTATGEQMGAFLLSLMLPIMFVIMVAVGSFYPAVDATAGERERSTWETTMTLATSRINVVTAKYLYVATFGCIAGFLNVGAMVLSMRSLIGRLLSDADTSFEFSVPLSAVPVMILAAVLLAAFVAAGMMIFASFARTFKEGQSMVTPFYLVILLPIFFLNDPGLRLDPKLALIPIVNVGLMVRDALAARFDAGLILLTTVVSLLLVGAALWLATRILAYEDVITGSYGGNFGRFLKERLLGRGKASTDEPDSGSPSSHSKSHGTDQS